MKILCVLAPSPRPLSKAERERQASSRLHRGLPTAGDGADAGLPLLSAGATNFATGGIPQRKSSTAREGDMVTQSRTFRK